MTTIGCDQPLYILPFDHRGSFQTKMFGWTGGLTPEQTAQIAAWSRDVAYVGATDFALELLTKVVDGGMHCPTPLVRDPWLDSLRMEPEFVRLLRRSEQEHAESVRAYVQAGGEQLLGVVG
jgi:hypothetical protein